MAEKKYSFKIGLQKSLKNVAIVVGIPTVVLFVNKWAEILPVEWHSWAAPIMGFVAYFVKNYVENK